MKNFYITFLSVLLFFATTSAQTVKQKIYPPDPTRTTAFGYSYENGIELDSNTLLVKDLRAPSTSKCKPNVGSVTVFKKNTNKEWTFSQLITPADSNETALGAYGFLHKNSLALISTSLNSWGDDILNYYTRNNANSPFVLRARLFAKTVPRQGIARFSSIAINDSYLVVNCGASYGNHVYKLQNDTLIFKKNFWGRNNYALQLGLTKNNILVARYNDGIEHFKISEDTVVSVFQEESYTNHYFEEFDIAGNTVVHKFSDYPNDTIGYAFLHLNETGVHNAIDTIFYKHADGTSLKLVENKWFFVGVRLGGLNPSPVQIDAYKFEANKFEFKGRLNRPSVVTEYYGEEISFDENVLVVSDQADSTINYTPTNPCEGKGKGAIYTFEIPDNFNGVVTSTTSVTESKKTGALVSPNPLKGRILQILAEGALTAELYNSNGTQLDKLPVMNKQIELGRLNSGLYLIKITTPSSILFERLIVD